MHTYVFEGVATALTSISHIGDVHGINAKLRREKIMQPDGQVEEVPVVSGNAVRGILRDRGMLHMLRTLGYGVNEETGEVNGLSLAAFYFLFSGGALTKTGQRGLDVDAARRWRSLVPLVALFGGAMGNQIMPGKAKIGKMIPICAETAHIIPQRFASKEMGSVWDMTQAEAYTRRDDEKNENLRALIEPETRALLEASAAQRRDASRDMMDHVSIPNHDDNDQKQQMRYYVETIAAGTRLFWDIALDDVTQLEFEAFCVTLAEFARWPYIGGKSGVGHGKIAIAFDQWIEINPRMTADGSALDFASGTSYMQHLSQHRDEIRGLFGELK